MSQEREIGGKGEISDQHSDHESLIVSEDEALARARSSPNGAFPLGITFGPNDPDNPRCWGYWRKWYITCFVSMLNVITYAALPLSPLILEHYLTNSSDAGAPAASPQELPKLLTNSTSQPKSPRSACPCTCSASRSGQSCLPAPLSEYFGRQPVYLVSWFIMALFQLPLALAPNIGTIIVCRFLTGDEL
jgi:hypothetical protein